MNVVVFGVSQGLGFSIVNQYLSLNCKVVGVGRRNTIVNADYFFLKKDLSVQNDFTDLWKNVDFNASEIVFIYNAGNLGDVNLISEIGSDPIALFQLNLFSWMQLVKEALSFSYTGKMTFVAISSGAGRRGIPGWAQYGASKAALDNFMLVLKEEMLAGGMKHRSFSLSPGVMDTQMQKDIRGFTDKEFPHVTFYKKLAQDSKLQNTDCVAKALSDFLSVERESKVLIGMQDLQE